MRAPVEISCKRSIVATLSMGLVVSLTALTGGLAPAYAKPGDEPIVPTTTVAPEPKVRAPEEAAAPELPQQEAPKAPVAEPAAPSGEPQPQIQAPQPPPSSTTVVIPIAPASPKPVEAVAPAPVETAAPAPKETAAPAPVETTAEAPAPRPAPSTPAPATSEPARVTSAGESPASAAPATSSAPASASVSPATDAEAVSPSEALVAPTDASEEPAASESATAPTESKADAPSGTSGAPSAPSTVSQAAKAIETSVPETLQAPKGDIELAKNAKPVEVKADPAPEQDVVALSSALRLDRNPDGLRVDADQKAEVNLARGRDRDRNVRQWRPEWVEYDEYYRPIILNPYRDAVRIVYVYQNAPRIVWIPPLARIVLEVAQFAAYSFTAVVDTARDIVHAAVDTAVDVAVGTFFGGGYFPGAGLPLPPPPPPVWRYDNVPVQVRYSDAVYEPFRVRRIVDVGDDARFGERKVLLDGATPAWGVWTQTATGERQFEVHRTQQFPGLDEPREGPLPGDYRLQLASDDASTGLTARDIWLYVAAGVCALLSLGAVGWAILLGRRRPAH